MYDLFAHCKLEVPAWRLANPYIGSFSRTHIIPTEVALPGSHAGAVSGGTLAVTERAW
jgi:hypothetical protein